MDDAVQQQPVGDDQGEPSRVALRYLADGRNSPGDDLGKDERDRLFQASHKLFFKPADTELPSFAQILQNATGEKADDWVRKLSSLSRGECYSLGPAQNDATGGLDTRKYFKLRILPLEKRF